MRLSAVLTVSAALVLTAVVAAQDLPTARSLFEAGKYQEAVNAIAKATVDPQTRLRLDYLDALSRERLSQPADAERLYSELVSSPDAAWKGTGQSALDVMHKQPMEALTAAMQAVAANADLAEAQYQLGIALSVNQDYARAAAAFDKAAQLDPQWAYPLYYAGLSYSKIKRVDLLASRFQAFLKLAPNAPERPEVESIMRTIRGR
jgi:tetratricopeptide (TPR) repeat protein